MQPNVLQNTQDWHDLRTGRVTASRAGSILGLSPYASRDDVMREMVRECFGAEREFQGNVATQWGTDNEPRALEWLEQETGELVVSTGFHIHSDHDWLGASPDGFIGDDVVEVKCPYRQELFNPLTRPDYVMQVQIAMAVTGRKLCRFVVWTPSYAQLTDIPARDITGEIEQLKAFHDEYLSIIEDDKKVKPYLEDAEQMMSDLEWFEAAEQLRLANHAIEAHKAQADEAKQRLINLADGRKSRGAGVLVYPVKGRVSVDYKKAIADNLPNMDLSAYQKEGKESWAVKLS